VAASDSFVARRLREAGAVLLGKSNLSEWANIRSSRSSSGWSARGGQCRNPYVLDRNPCGSSSGSGAAVSANLAAAALGTETNGSIVCPASANGIVGLKPTVGLVSRSRIIPISHTQDTAGPMTRTVRDAAMLLGALAGVDPEDAATAASADRAAAEYTRFLDADGLRGARIGVARQFFGFHPEVDAVMAQAIEAMKLRGAVVVDPVEFENRDEMDSASYLVLLYDLRADLDAYLAGLGPGAPVRTLDDVIAFNEANRDREMPYFGQEVFLEAQSKGPLTEPEYLEARARALRLAREEGIDRLLQAESLDAIIAPTGGPAWPTDLINGDHFTGGSSSPAAIAGYPNITVPAGAVRGLPVGISFFGAAWTEPVLLRLAYAFEQATMHRRPPGFLPTLDLS
jgi:amidase